MLQDEIMSWTNVIEIYNHWTIYSSLHTKTVNNYVYVLKKKPTL